MKNNYECLSCRIYGKNNHNDHLYQNVYSHYNCKNNMKKTNKQELKNKMLNTEQASTVREMIIASMKDVYTSKGILPGADFTQAAGFVADKIIKNTQMALIQNNVYAKAVDTSKPIKSNIKSSVSIKLISKGKQVGETKKIEVKGITKGKKILAGNIKTKKYARK